MQYVFQSSYRLEGRGEVWSYWQIYRSLYRVCDETLVLKLTVSNKASIAKRRNVLDVLPLWIALFSDDEQNMLNQKWVSGIYAN